MSLEDRCFFSQVDLLLLSLFRDLDGSLSLDNVFAKLDELVDAVLLNVVEVQPGDLKESSEFFKFFLLKFIVVYHFVFDCNGHIYF